MSGIFISIRRYEKIVSSGQRERGEESRENRRLAFMWTMDYARLLLFVMCIAFGSYLSRGEAIGDTYTCKKEERDALLSFKAGFWDTKEVLRTWKNDTNCCQWVGITCNSDGLVQALELGFSGVYYDEDGNEVNYLQRNFLDDGIDVVGEYLPHLKALEVLNLSTVGISNSIPPSLGQLTNLKILSLSHSRLFDSIPPEIGNLSKLQVLDLNFNVLRGNIPEELCNLHDLQSLFLSGKTFTEHQNTFQGVIPKCLGAQQKSLSYLDFSFNELEGPIPQQLGQSISLQYLDLSRNSLNESIPDQLCKLTQLRSLDLSYNWKLGGNLPSCLYKLNVLQKLSLEHNRFTGPIPSLLGSLQSLRHLSLEENKFTGTIPSQLASLRNLQHLSLGSDSISGTLPTSFGNLLNLETLSIQNCALHGSIPVELGRLSKLQTLIIEKSGMTGSIPPSLGNLSQLTQLSLAQNKLTGSVPNELGTLRKLTSLDLGSNRLEGSVPSGLGNLVALTQMKLNSNHLSGQIPAELFHHLARLSRLDLSNNIFTGTIPPSIDDINSDATRIDWDAAIDLSHNQFTGSFPLSLCKFRTVSLSNNVLTDLQANGKPNITNKLENLDVSNNRLTGKFPTWLGEQESLYVLDLSNNSLTGTMVFPSGRLSRVNLSNNKLSGELRSLPAADNIDLHSNRLHGLVSFKFSGIQPGLLSSIDLSQNLFSGPLPNSLPEETDFSYISILSVAGNKLSGGIPSFLGTTVQRLERLDLSYNGLTGEIPTALANISYGSFSDLILDLAHNQLTGQIPKELGEIRHLKEVDLSYNHLEGTIPRQWSNFSAASFEGNAGLCGAPLGPCKKKRFTWLSKAGKYYVFRKS